VTGREHGQDLCAICEEPYDGREHEHELWIPDDVAAEMTEHKDKPGG
jgi:hypothetical protein